MKICALIPVYNQVSTIRSVVEKVRTFVDVIVVIDDGSTDRSAEEAKASGAQVVAHNTNKGKGAALKKGFDYACTHNFDAALTLDSDGQHDPCDAEALIAARHTADIIVGSRMQHHRTMPFLIYLTNRLLSYLIFLYTKTPIRDSQSGFRLIHTKVLRSISLTANHYETETELLIKACRAGYTACEVPIATIYFRRLPRRTLFRDFFLLVKLFCSSHLYRS